MSSNEKYLSLLKWFDPLEKVAVAFSGGVDSTFLLALIHKVAGKKVLALTIKTPYIPNWELAEAETFCKENNIEHRTISTGMLPEIMNNPENRCYLCKSNVFKTLKKEAFALGFKCLIDGTNADDSGIYRPGLAALRELDIKSPLMDNGITKNEVRQFSERLGLSTSKKPSYACLLTRMPLNLINLLKAKAFGKLGFWKQKKRWG